MTLAEFLLARIAEDEAAARGVAPRFREWEPFSMRFLSYESDHTDGDNAFVDRFNPERVLAECEAKRAAVDWYLNDDDYVMSATVKAMAAVYADHPEYDEAWRHQNSG